MPFIAYILFSLGRGGCVASDRTFLSLSVGYLYSFLSLSVRYVKVIQCFVLVMEYIRGSGAPECIFHKQHKTLYNLFSPDPAVSCVDFTS